MLALHANGYRTLTSKRGHHPTAIQPLALTVSLPAAKVWLLGALRKQRNLADYSGDLVPDSTASACLGIANDVQPHLLASLKVTQSDLL